MSGTRSTNGEYEFDLALSLLLSLLFYLALTKLLEQFRFSEFFINFHLRTKTQLRSINSR